MTLTRPELGLQVQVAILSFYVVLEILTQAPNLSNKSSYPLSYLPRFLPAPAHPPPLFFLPPCPFLFSGTKIQALKVAFHIDPCEPSHGAVHTPNPSPWKLEASQLYMSYSLSNLVYMGKPWALSHKMSKTKQNIQRSPERRHTLPLRVTHLTGPRRRLQKRLA